MTLGYGLSNDMFNTQRINFHGFDGNKNGSPKEHKFRVLPAYAPGKLFHKVGLHWGFRTADGQMKAITCGLEERGSCPICDKINQLKGQLENINAALTTAHDPQERAQLEQQKSDIELYVGEHRRKPMYLWNIVTEEGDQKVLQLSWNGHDPLFEKIKFIFNQKKIDVTNVQNSILMYCNRSGLKAKTRYVYEMLEGTERALDGITSLTDLSKVYVAKSLEYLQQVVDQEMVPADQEDPNDRNFNAQQQNQQMPGMMPPAGIQQPTNPNNLTHPTGNESQMGNVPAQPATQVQTQSTAPAAESTSAPTASHSNPTVDQPVNLSAEQDKNVAEMMAALKG